ncbi:alpha-1,2-fucosyltransferase [Acidipropionibacterium timonense]|uniref:alpha-1,2-fucosyltransferase n=1 Tax=Acidipropionibacterium timonense TaxID=2161818 RepID=UPI001FDA4D9F|nr:alpha-1,2-fucosyltransferase [Acidipropionibacterium timonense]
MVLRSIPFSAALAQVPRNEKRVVINVRRGDYYSVPYNRGMYSFDIQEYIKVAIQRALDQQDIPSIHLVSDDIPWCQLRLGWLNQIAPTTYESTSRTVLTDLAAIATANRLILANSTFSYWGAYISNILHSNFDTVIAPRFHSRKSASTSAGQLDPRWTIIENIPGGWDS